MISNPWDNLNGKERERIGIYKKTIAERRKKGGRAYAMPKIREYERYLFYLEERGRISRTERVLLYSYGVEGQLHGRAV